VGLSAVAPDVLELFVSNVPRGAGFRRVCIVAKIAFYLRHVRPSVRIYQPDSHGTDLREIWYRGRVW
jgi:hypothetical protein